MRKPWEEEGVSRATWYRRHRETIGETETAETAVRQACEIETACETGAPSHVPALDETAPETMQSPASAAVLAENAEDQGVHHRDQVSQKSTDQPWRMSDVDAARRADQYRAARAQKGEAIANRVLRWELQDAGVPYQRLQHEVDRIHALAASETCYN